MINRDYTFALTDAEYARLKEWYDEIMSNSPYAGITDAIGGELTFKITPTSIGDLVAVSCFGQDLLLRPLFAHKKSE